MATIPFRRRDQIKRGRVEDLTDEEFIFVEAWRIAAAPDDLEGLAIDVPDGRTIPAMMTPEAFRRAKAEIAFIGRDAEVLVRGTFCGDAVLGAWLDVRPRFPNDR